MQRLWRIAPEKCCFSVEKVAIYCAIGSTGRTSPPAWPIGWIYAARAQQNAAAEVETRDDGRRRWGPPAGRWAAAGGRRSVFYTKMKVLQSKMKILQMVHQSRMEILLLKNDDFI